MTQESDVELMLRVKRRGDRDAFRALVERHQGAIINFIHRQIGDRWEAEDLAQHVFISVFHSAKRYKPSAKFTTWLFTIARNTCLNEIRRRSRHKAESFESMQNPEDDSPAHQLADARARTPSDETQETELEERIRAAIRSLPEDQRTAITLLRYEDMAYEEIAKVLRCSVGAVKSLIFRAREKLKADIIPYLKGK